jgi:uncharacterized protein YgiB involved in biofilm formation
MKRSRVVRLALLGSASALALAACDEPKDPLVGNKDFFQDPAQCARTYDDATCKAAFAQAQEEHARTAPKFGSREECEAKFGVGNCQWGQALPGQQASSGGGGFFMPMMMGYMLGNMMNRGAAGVPPTSGVAGSRPSGFSSSPVYRDTSNTVYTGNRTLGTTSISAAPTARGGFGSTSKSYSSASAGS